MKKITDEQAKKVTERLRSFHMPLQTMLEDCLGDQFDSVTIVCALKPKARTKKQPCVAVVCGTHEFGNTVFALKVCLDRVTKWEEKA